MERMITAASPYQTFPPVAALRNVVAFFWTYEPCSSDSARKQLRLLPDGLPGFVLQHNNGGSVYRNAASFLPVSFIYGQATAAYLNYSINHAYVTGVCFQPGAISTLFGIPASDLTDRHVAFSELAPPFFEERLLELKTVNERIELLTSLFLKKLINGPGVDPLIGNSVCQLLSTQGKLPISRLHREYHLSERQFERRFKERVGLRPSQYKRITRFQAVVRRLNDGTIENHAGLAYDLGYADQSHFIRDFKEFSGITPKQYQAELFSALVDAPLSSDNKISRYPIRILKYG